MYKINTSNTVLNDDGKVIFWSVQDFVENICNSDNCFLCGESRHDKAFNDEHIIPQWILREFDLYNDSIGLLNNARINYSRYVIPCCVDCNSWLGKEIETKVQNIFNCGFESFTDYVKENSPWLIITWLALIFIKTHCKDRYYQYLRDKRKTKNCLISDFYQWEELHHIYCIARAKYANAKIDMSSLSSFVVFPISGNYTKEFDYLDSFDGKTVMLRYHDIGIISVLDDGCACANICRELMESISAPLIPLQARELFVHYLYSRIRLETKTEFYSTIDAETQEYIINATRNETFSISEFDYTFFGKLLWHYLKDEISHFSGLDFEIIKSNILSGHFSYLLDEHGSFQDLSK